MVPFLVANAFNVQCADNYHLTPKPTQYCHEPSISSGWLAAEIEPFSSTTTVCVFVNFVFENCATRISKWPGVNLWGPILFYLVSAFSAFVLQFCDRLHVKYKFWPTTSLDYKLYFHAKLVAMHFHH